MVRSLNKRKILLTSKRSQQLENIINAVTSNDERLKLAEVQYVDSSIFLEKEIKKAVKKGGRPKNQLLNRYICNDAVWVMDATKIGKHVVFSVLALDSLACKGYIVTGADIDLSSDDILALLGMLVHECVVKKVTLPLFIHGDQSPLYESKEVKTFIRQVMSCKLSTSISIKHGNQVSESFNNSLKKRVASNILENITPGEKAAFFKVLNSKLLNFDLKKKSNAQLASSKQVRDILFKSSFFEKTVVREEIIKAIHDLNDRFHTIYKMYTRNQVEYYISVITINRSKFKGFKRDSAAASMAVALKYRAIVETNAKLEALLANNYYKKDKPITEVIHLESLQKLNVEVNDDLEESCWGLVGLIKGLQKRVSDEKGSGSAELVPLEKPVLQPDSILLNKVTINEEVLQILLNMVYTGFQLTLQQNAQLQKSIDSVDNKVTEQSRSLRKLVTHIKEAEKVRELKKTQRKKLESLCQLELSKPLKPEHYKSAMDIIGPELDPLKAKMRLLITLMFLTGVPLKKLLSIKIENIRNLFEKQRPYIEVKPEIKGTGSKLIFSEEGNAVLKDRVQDYVILKLLLVNGSDLLFKINTGKPFSRDYFMKSINRVFKTLKNEYQTCFLTNRFRASYILEWWKCPDEAALASVALGFSLIGLGGPFSREGFYAEEIAAFYKRQEADRVKKIKFKKRKARGARKLKKS